MPRQCKTRRFGGPTGSAQADRLRSGWRADLRTRRTDIQSRHQEGAATPASRSAPRRLRARAQTQGLVPNPILSRAEDREQRPRRLVSTQQSNREKVCRREQIQGAGSREGNPKRDGSQRGDSCMLPEDRAPIETPITVSKRVRYR